jgi:cyclophilin family peptidyl-prolyl cis-trans isomerase
VPRRIAIFALIAAIVIAVIVVVATTGGDEPPPSTTAAAAVTDTISTNESLAFSARPGACGGDRTAAARSMRFSTPDDLGLDDPVIVILHTSCGAITLELDPGLAPATVNSFVFLAEQGYFDGTVSHRVAPGFVIQAGDPTATGSGGPGYFLPDELPAPGFVYIRGTVAMANSGPNSGGSQFFLVLEDTPLGPDFSVFGTVSDGLDVMDRIAALPLTTRGVGRERSSPLETLYLERVETRR